MQQRLMGQLAQFSTFYKQGEVLCTQGLAFLLRDSGARSALSACILERSGRSVSPDLVWRSEVRQLDRGRVDLEGCNVRGELAAKIEAKLGAALLPGQLRSYAKDLGKRCGAGVDGLLVLLVPDYRVKEATNVAIAVFGLSGIGPWHLDTQHKNCWVAIISWDKLIVAMEGHASESLASDLAQFKAMYKVLAGKDIQPFATEPEVLAWRERKTDYIKIVDRLTSRLTQVGKVLPMANDRDGIYLSRRYVAMRPGAHAPCYSVGLRDPFVRHKTPIWLRFHSDTAMFHLIHANIVASDVVGRLVESGGNMWIPLEVPKRVDGDGIVASLVAQTNTVLEAANNGLGIS